MSENRLTFDEVSHTYHYDGVQIPNVTSVIAPLSDYSRVPAHIMAHAQQRGTAVHKACELYLLNDLDETSLDETVAPYFYQFVKFMRESGFSCEHSELRVFHSRLRYAGTLDLAGDLNRCHSLIDLKTPIVMNPATGPQTAAYEDAYRDMLGIRKSKRIKRFGLKLQPDHYELIPFEDSNDINVFMAMKTLYHWKESNS